MPGLMISIIRYLSKGKVDHLNIEAIERGTFGSPSTTVANLYIYIYIYIYKECFELSFYLIFKDTSNFHEALSQ